MTSLKQSLQTYDSRPGPTETKSLGKVVGRSTRQWGPAQAFKASRPPGCASSPAHATLSMSTFLFRVPASLTNQARERTLLAHVIAIPTLQASYLALRFPHP